jgi:hypothetical protein
MRPGAATCESPALNLKNRAPCADRFYFVTRQLLSWSWLFNLVRIPRQSLSAQDRWGLIGPTRVARASPWPSSYMTQAAASAPRGSRS